MVVLGLGGAEVFRGAWKWWEKFAEVSLSRVGSDFETEQY